MKPKSKSQAKRFKAMGAPERTPLAGRLREYLTNVHVRGKHYRHEKDDELVAEVAALEQERAEWVECAKLLGFKEVEIRRLRTAIREALKFERGDQWRAILVDALTKPEGEQEVFCGTCGATHYSVCYCRTKPEGDE